jgi:hypothetical protein
MSQILQKMTLALTLAWGAFSSAHGADLIANSGSVYLHADKDSYLGYSTSSNDQTLVHGVSGVFHSKLEASYDPYIFISADDNWSFRFEAPHPPDSATTSGRVPLQVGFYDNAARSPFNASGVPGMDVSVNASGYSTLSGWFNVLDIAYDGNTQVTALAIDFVEYGNATKSGPALFGSLRFNSSIPLRLGLLGLGLVLRHRTGLRANG